MIKKRYEFLIALNNFCNLSCSYCDKWKGTKYINEINFSHLIDQILELDTQYICLWWWEPLLHPRFFKIVEILTHKISTSWHGVNLAINTNGLLLNTYLEKLKSVIELNPRIQFTLYVSLDWITELENQKRGLNNSQIRTIIDSIIVLKKQNFQNLNIVISSVLVLSNIPLHIFHNFINFFKNLGIDIHFCFEEIIESNSFWITPKSEKSLITRALLLKKLWIHIGFENALHLNSLYRIDYNGDIYNTIDSTFSGSYEFKISKDYQLIPNIYKNISVASQEEIFRRTYKDIRYIALIKQFISL